MHLFSEYIGQQGGATFQKMPRNVRKLTQDEKLQETQGVEGSLVLN